MKRLLVLLLVSPFLVASSITWVNDGADGWATGDDWDAANVLLIEPAVDDNDARIDALLAVDTCTTPPCDITAGTTLGGAAIQTGVEDDVPEAGDFGAATDLDADGKIDSTATTITLVKGGLLSPFGDEDRIETEWCYTGDTCVAKRIWVSCDGTGTQTVTFQVCNADKTGCVNIHAAITCDTQAAPTVVTAITSPNVAANKLMNVIYGDPTAVVNSIAWTVWTEGKLVK